MATHFETFAALHIPGDPVVLYNIWDAGTRRRDIDIAAARGSVEDLTAASELQALEGRMRALMDAAR